MSLLGFVWLMFGFYRRLGVRRTFRWTGVVVVAVGAILTVGRSTNADAQYYRESVVAVPERALLLWSDAEDAFRISGLIGIGTGTGSQGIDYVPGGGEWAVTSDLSSRDLWGETGLGKVMGELGLIGLVGFVLLLRSMGIAWLKNVGSLRTKAPFPVSASLAVFFSMMLVWFAKGHQILGDPVTLVQFWFFMGIFFALPRYRSSQ
jgi:hypothetical protein